MPITLDQLNAYQARQQGLTHELPWDAGAQPFVGLYGTGRTLYPSLLARAPRPDIHAISRALYDERSLARFRAMRGSLFANPTALVPAIWQATHARTINGYKGTLKYYRVSPDDYAQAAPFVRDLLDGAPRTKAEIKRALAARSEGWAHGVDAIVGALCAEGTLVRASIPTAKHNQWKSDQTTFARFEQWLPGVDLHAVTEAEGRRALARHYFLRYGPATLEDFTWWSGLAKAEAAEAAGALDGLAPVIIDGLPGDFLHFADTLPALRAAEPGGELRLLPVWDAYTMAYRRRERYLEPARFAQVYDEMGDGASVIVESGRMTGLWDWGEEKATVTVKIAPFAERDAAFWHKARAAAAAFAQAVLPGGRLAVMRCQPPERVSRGTRNHGRAPLAGIEGPPLD